MLFYLGEYLKEFFGPARLFQSYTVLIAIALYLGFFLSRKLIPKFYNKLPHDRGREFAIKETSDAAKDVQVQKKIANIVPKNIT